MKPDLNHSLLMQYQTPLEDGSPMADVRKRVADLAPVFDRYPGLYFKLMAVNDLGNAPINEYTSIYLWQESGEMLRFLAGDRFHSYVRAFARPSVRWWLTHSFAGDLAALPKAKYIVRQSVGIPRAANVGAFINSWKKRQRNEESLVELVALDPGQWELVTMRIVDQEVVPRWKSEIYKVEHVSLPIFTNSLEKNPTW